MSTLEPSNSQNQQFILDNPFHPLDLSAHDLLTVFKKFDISREANRNPKHELSIEAIAQLISSLKGCKPSYIQKCMTQALIKQTLSWNDFLAFLDQESEVREKILDWLIHERSIIKYKFRADYPFRQKIQRYYKEINQAHCLNIGKEKLMLTIVDHKKVILIRLTNNKFQELDSYIKKNVSEKKGRSQIQNTTKNQSRVQTEGNSNKNTSKSKKSKERISARKFYKSMRQSKKKNSNFDMTRQKVQSISEVTMINPIDRRQRKPHPPSHIVPSIKNLSNIKKGSSKFMKIDVNSRDPARSSMEKYSADQQTYFKKEKKNIHSLFSLWKDLPLEQSKRLAQQVTPLLQNKALNYKEANQILNSLSEYTCQDRKEEKKNEEEKITPAKKLERIKGYFYQQKAELSYNPRNIHRMSHLPVRPHEVIATNPKKHTFDRKQKEHFPSQYCQKYNDQLKCLAILFYNEEICLLKIHSEYNKISLEEHDTLFIGPQKKVKLGGVERESFEREERQLNQEQKEQKKKNKRKNQAIYESLEFYYHRITQKWFLLLACRTDFQDKEDKHVPRQTWIKGYQIQVVEDKRKGQQSFSFANRKEQFEIQLDKVEMMEIIGQPNYGIHLISHIGRYITMKQTYIEGQKDSIYFQKEYDSYKTYNQSFSCLCVCEKFNKTLIGTINGMLIIFDQLSTKSKQKKISTSTVNEIKIDEEHSYIFCANEKIVIYDIIRNEEIQVLNVKNEEKLHEKVRKFILYEGNIITYGTYIRVFDQFVDESLQHEKRKMKTIYTWRLNKLQKTTKQYAITNQKQKSRIQEEEKVDDKNNAEIFITSDNFFIILTDIHEVIFLYKKTLEVKFTFILDIPYDSKVMKMMISPDEKLLGILLFNQNIHVFNVFTQEELMFIKSGGERKYTTLAFLDKRNEYFMAAGGENGDIFLIPFASVPQKPIKTLECHKKSVLITLLKNEYLITTAEDNTIAIWQLPFNVLRHEIKKPSLEYIYEHIGYYQQNVCFLRTIDGTIAEVNLNEGLLKRKHTEYREWTYSVSDHCMGYLIGVNKQNIMCVMEKNVEKGRWEKKNQVKIALKGEIIGLGVIASQKVVIFSQNQYCAWTYRTQKFSKVRTFTENPVMML